METKVINYRGGVVSFSIPKHWKEKYEPEGGGAFYEDGPHTGTLRLNVLTGKWPTRITNNWATEILLAARCAKSTTELEELPQGNVLAKSIIRTKEQNQDISTFVWHIANPMPSQHFRLANFTYTVLSRLEQEPRIRSELEFLDKQIREAKFHPTLGNQQNA